MTNSKYILTQFYSFLLLFLCAPAVNAEGFLCTYDAKDDKFSNISLTEQIEEAEFILLLAIRDIKNLPDKNLKVESLSYPTQSPVQRGTFEILEILKGDRNALVDGKEEGLKSVVHDVHTGVNGIPTRFDSKALTYFARHKYATDNDVTNTGVTVFDPKWLGPNASALAKDDSEQFYIFFCAAPLTKLSFEPVFDYQTDPLYIHVKRSLLDRDDNN